jgi:Glycosyl transferase family 2
MKLFTAINHDAQLLGHFLNHYQRAKVTDFYIAVDPRWERTVNEYVSEYNVTVVSALDVSDTVIGGVSAVTELRNRYQRPTEWVIIVDLDEFVEFPDTIEQIIGRAESEGANVVAAVMWDRFSADGRICGFERGADLSHVYPIKARFIRDVMSGCDIKGVLVKGLLASNGAHHTFKDEVVCSESLNLSHYKWTAGSIERLRTAYQRVVASGQSWAPEYAAILDHYDRHGRFAWSEFGGEPVAAPPLEPADDR